MPECTTPTRQQPLAIRPLPTNIDELYQGFRDLLTTPKTSCSEIFNIRGPEHLDGPFTIYPLHYLPSHETIPHPEQDTLATTKPLRFIISTQDKLWFAFNGRAQYRVPYHTEIATHCFSAGEVLINAENKICQINNKSGHFRPCWTRLIYLIQHILQAPELLSETLNITAMVGPAPNDLASFDIPVEELLSNFHIVQNLTKHRDRPRDIFRGRHQPRINDEVYFVSRNLFPDTDDSSQITSLPYAPVPLIFSPSMLTLGSLGQTALVAPPAKRSNAPYTPLRSSFLSALRHDPACDPSSSLPSLQLD